MSDTASKAVTLIGKNELPFWGITNAERVTRLASANGQTIAADGDILTDLAFAYDPLWYRHIVASPGLMLTRGGRAILAHCPTDAARKAVAQAMAEGRAVGAVAGMTAIAVEEGASLTNTELRSRITPFADVLTQTNIPALERASYFGAYKGVTDVLTKYLWPEWALVLTRIAARLGISPNQVTAVGFVLCLYAMWLFWFGHYWWGMLAGLVFMVLDTVDGKLARCTITSSWWGNIFDHGIDLIHPPFWWWAWGVGLVHWGQGLSNTAFAITMAVIVGGYVVQRLIEGQFILRNGGIHIHIWQKIDSQFRLITARRNPNMVILFAATLVGRPDMGLIAVAAWTALSCLFHLVRLAQAELARRKTGPLTSWMERLA